MKDGLLATDFIGPEETGRVAGAAWLATGREREGDDFPGVVFLARGAVDSFRGWKSDFVRSGARSSPGAGASALHTAAAIPPRINTDAIFVKDGILKDKGW